MGPRCPVDNPSLLVEGPSASPDLDWHLTYCRDLKSRKFTTTKYEYTHNCKTKVYEDISNVQCATPGCIILCSMEALKAILNHPRAYVTKNRDCAQWQATSCFKIIGRLLWRDHPIAIYGRRSITSLQICSVRGREGGGTTYMYSFFAKNIYAFHMIFQKFA